MGLEPTTGAPRRLARCREAPPAIDMFFGNVLGEVFSSLDTEGFFPDPLAIEIEETFLPWLLDGVATQ
ncbi:hypothetical protein T484DRAFT_1846670, partial [Baffinella frigidus]